MLADLEKEMKKAARETFVFEGLGISLQDIFLKSRRIRPR